MKRLLVVLFLIFPLVYSHGEEILKESAIAYRDEGYKLQSAGNYQGAMVYYQKAVQMYPQYVEAHNDLGVVYEAMGNYERAIKEYKTALELQDNYLPAYTNLGFIYEKIGDIKNASIYWQKRYELGEKGEYWWEVARQHLLKLGTYPQIKKEMMERAAADLSRELVYQREQQRLKVIEEARLHFDIGANLFLKGDYSSAIKEFDTALSLNPQDNKLKGQIMDFYRKAKKLQIKQKAIAETEAALTSIRDDDYLSAGEKLKSAMSAVFSISSEN